jgi:hypothetical protein
MEKNNLNNPQIDRIIHFLEYEVSSRLNKAKSSGWTTWVILATMASLLWLMLSILSSTASISWRNALFISLFSSVFFDFIFFLNMALSSATISQPSTNNRFEPLDFSKSSFLFLVILRTLSLMLLLKWFSPILSQLVYFSCWAFLIPILIITDFGLVILYFQIPIPVKPKQKHIFGIHLLHIILSLAGGVATFGLFGIIYSKTFVPSITEWQIGFIIFALSLLSLLLSRSKPNTPLLLQLDSIRQRLSMGQIDIDTAQKRIELIIHGLKLIDILQSKLNDVLVTLNNIQTIYEKSNLEVERILHYIDTPQEGFTKDDKIPFEALKSLSNYQNEHKSANKILLKHRLSLERKISFFGAMIEGKALDLENIEGAIDLEYQKIGELTGKMDGYLLEWKNKLGKTKP